MANAKISDYITRARQTARAYAAVIEELRQMGADWDTLYVGVVNDDEFQGENRDIITADGASYTATLAAMIGNAETIVTAFDTSYRQNFERVE